MSPMKSGSKLCRFFDGATTTEQRWLLPPMLPLRPIQLDCAASVFMTGPSPRASLVRLLEQNVRQLS